MQSEIISELRSKRDSFNTKEDVSFVISFIAPPGQQRELKKSIVDQLFSSRSFQGYKTSDDLEAYGEY